MTSGCGNGSDIRIACTSVICMAMFYRGRRQKEGLATEAHWTQRKKHESNSNSDWRLFLCVLCASVALNEFAERKPGRLV
jgi:hypothetical protein